MRQPATRRGNTGLLGHDGDAHSGGPSIPRGRGPDIWRARAQPSSCCDRRVFEQSSAPTRRRRARWPSSPRCAIAATDIRGTTGGARRALCRRCARSAMTAMRALVSATGSHASAGGPKTSFAHDSIGTDTEPACACARGIREALGQSDLRLAAALWRWPQRRRATAPDGRSGAARSLVRAMSERR